VPGWHEATAELQAQGKLQMVGIVQEQHPDRARLFMQWKRMGWPLLVDSLNLLDVGVVPITLTIDEHGIVRGVHGFRDGGEDLAQRFLAQTFEGPETVEDTKPAPPDLSRLKTTAIREGSALAWRRYAEQLTLWGGPRRLDEAVTAFERALAVEPEDPATHFRFGAALRARYDTAGGHPGDFQRAVAEWGRALELDPNNYIWRRRVQQYGPRLTKPYPFYDWVAQAREEIAARGDVPHPLVIEPQGAELASPSTELAVARGTAAEPDPEDKVIHDRGRLVAVETTVVPRRVPPGEAARVHVVLRPRPGTTAHWNNEAGNLELWLAPPEGVEVDGRRHVVPNAATAVSLEPRRVEFELQRSADASGKLSLGAYALYYVCEDARGACLYRRQDFTIPLE
jgi:tetratricopeptide (TPR) repeat protein